MDAGGASHDGVSAEDATLSKMATTLSSNSFTPTLSTLAKSGNQSLVERFLTEDVVIDPAEGLDVAAQVQLYTASFWGMHDSVQELLGQSGISTNVQNNGSAWTPLHAAAFQEHGRCVEALLGAGAKVDVPDCNGVTAADFASCSDKIWGHFALAGAKRRSKQELLDRGIIAKLSAEEKANMAGDGKVNVATYFSRPDSAYRLNGGAGRGRPRTGARGSLSGGDILGFSTGNR